MNLRRFQQIVCAVVLVVLYRAIRVLSHADSRIREELRQMPQGRTVCLSVSPDEKAPSLTFSVADGTIRRCARSMQPDIHIVFKSETMAFRVFTGRMGIAGAYAAHAFTLRGNINETMGVVRVVDLVEGYLFPRFMTRRILKEVPEKQLPTLAVYLRLIPGV